ncbi:MAG: hypothetical protein MUF13_01395 [Akkermansiaceae bacterium]|nr:hypothetical protein [Akkermansiaceae bacterium]
MHRSILGRLMVAAALLSTATANAAQLELNNGTLKIRTDNTYGGSIVWLSTAAGSLNLVNIHDRGREIQQSYYAGANLTRSGQIPNYSPWSWNPVQAGSYSGTPSIVDSFSLNNGILYSWTRPKLWDVPNETAQAVIKQWTQFEPGMSQVIRVTNQLVCLRSNNDAWGSPANRHQELPACYFIRALNRAKIYNGNGSWSDYNYPLLSSNGWGRPNPPKKAMAFFLANDFGVGIYSPASTTAWNCGATGTSASTDPTHADTMHVAPLATLAFDRQTQFTFNYWIVMGNQATIRTRLDQLLALYPNG